MTPGAGGGSAGAGPRREWARSACSPLFAPAPHRLGTGRGVLDCLRRPPGRAVPSRPEASREPRGRAPLPSAAASGSRLASPGSAAGLRSRPSARRHRRGRPRLPPLNDISGTCTWTADGKPIPAHVEQQAANDCPRRHPPDSDARRRPTDESVRGRDPMPAPWIECYLRRFRRRRASRGTRADPGAVGSAKRCSSDRMPSSFRMRQQPLYFFPLPQGHFWFRGTTLLLCSCRHWRSPSAPCA